MKNIEISKYCSSVIFLLLRNAFNFEVKQILTLTSFVAIDEYSEESSYKIHNENYYYCRCMSFSNTEIFYNNKLRVIYFKARYT